MQRLLDALDAAVRRHPRHRADRLGQVDDAVRGDQQDERPAEPTSSPSRTRSSTGSRDCRRCRCTRRPGLTFAAALRSILRQDPDKVMIGEIRDKETGTIAIEAALTGHLVLSTLHTNDAPSAHHPTHRDGHRAVPLGVGGHTACSPSDSRAGCARSARRRTRPRRPRSSGSGSPSSPGSPPTLYRARGCKKCNGIGYKGRMGIHEVMTMSETPRAADGRERARPTSSSAQAVEEGMLTLRDDGFAKVKAGPDVDRGDPARRRLGRWLRSRLRRSVVSTVTFVRVWNMLVGRRACCRMSARRMCTVFGARGGALCMADNPLGDFFISDVDDELLDDDEPIVAAVVVPAPSQAAAPRPSPLAAPAAAPAPAPAPQPMPTAARAARPAAAVASGEHARSGWRRRSTT